MRIQLTIDDQRKDEVDLLKQVTDSKDYAALLDASLTAFQWMVWEVAQGRSIVSVKEGEPKERVLVMKQLQMAEQRLPGIVGKFAAASATADR